MRIGAKPWATALSWRQRGHGPMSPRRRPQGQWREIGLGVLVAVLLAGSHEVSSAPRSGPEPERIARGKAS